jgi:stalled ribosome alternative rescue factor ArfA
MSNKENVISQIYFDPGGFGSIKQTFQDARKKDNSITLDDVKEFFRTRVEKKNKAYGFNSFVAPRPYYEYQVDLFFINDLDNQKYKIGMLMINIFTKYMVVVPIASKSEK